MSRVAMVSGAAGFLGRHLVEALSRGGWRVTALCLPGDEAEPLRAAGARVVEGTILDRAALVRAMPEAPEAVFHVAANTSSWSAHDEEQYEVNVVGTANMIEAALQRSARRFVYTSSISAYGYHPGHRITESTPSNALTCGINYAKTKLEAEQLVKQAAGRRLAAVILNPVNILGPYDRTNWTRQLVVPVARGTLRVVPPGTAMWAHVKDIVAAHIAAVDRGVAGENYLLGGVEASFKDVINEIQRLLGKPPSRHVTPVAVMRLGLWVATLKAALDGKEPFVTPERYKRAVAHISCDDLKARRVLGFESTPLRVTLAETIRWLRAEHLVAPGGASEPARDLPAEVLR